MPEWSHRVVLEMGMYMRQNTATKNWHLFNSKGKPLGSGETIREIEEIYNKLISDKK